MNLVDPTAEIAVPLSWHGAIGLRTLGFRHVGVAMKQHAPVKFGEPFDPKSVDGVRLARRMQAEARCRREMNVERAAALEAAKPLRLVLWDTLRDLVGRPQ